MSRFWDAAFSRIASYSVTGCLCVDVLTYACGSGNGGKWFGMCDGSDCFVPADSRLSGLVALIGWGAGIFGSLWRLMYVVMPFIDMPRLTSDTTMSPKNGCVRPDSSAYDFDECAISMITACGRWKKEIAVMKP